MDGRSASRHVTLSLASPKRLAYDFDVWCGDPYSALRLATLRPGNLSGHSLEP